MQGDFSRDTFVKEKHYNRVLMQQGRVQLDADWNEQQAIHRHYMEAEGRDVIGKCGAPENEKDSFKIEVNGDNFNIKPGRYYVDGILCENDDPNCNFLTQLDLPQKDPNPNNQIGPVKSLSQEDKYLGLVYLDVWNRNITSLDDSHIREKALGGPDSTTRVKTVWQVKIFPLKGNQENQKCDNVEEWKEFIMRREGRMVASIRPSKDETPCHLPPQSKYYGHENQLYRVEIHNPGALDAATFKWSKDNGSVVSTIKNINGTTIAVTDCGKDNIQCFSENQWVEVADDYTELHSEPNQLVQIKSVNYEQSEIVVDSQIAFRENLHPKLRRWDQNGNNAGLPIKNEQELENGIHVEFKEGEYKTGDYWLIPARTATGDIEWPPYDGSKKGPQFRLGTYHHYCPLALIRRNGEILDADYTIKNDCRRTFPPLTELKVDDTEKEAIYVESIYIYRNINGEALVALANDSEVPISILEKGIFIACDRSIDPRSIEEISPKPVCTVTIDIPYPATEDEGRLWGFERPVPIGSQPIILNSILSLMGENKIIKWEPNEVTISALKNGLRYFREELRIKKGILSHLLLKGNFIWSPGNIDLYLDGEVFGLPRGNNDFNLRLKSGDGKMGGNLEMWFWLTPDR